MATNQHGPDEQPSPFKSRLFIASALFLAVVALLGVFVVVQGDGKDSDSTPRAADPTSAAPSPAPSTSGSGCPALTDTDTTVLTAAPKGVRWDLVDGFALPTSKASGPARVNGDVAHCYAHTPTGALVAAVQITARNMAASDWQSIVEQQTVGDGREAYLTKRRKIEKAEGSQALTADQHGQIAGFRFITYDDSTAVVDLVWRSKNGDLGAGTATMKWSGGDWKNEIPATPAAPGGAIDSMAGYITWGGV